MKRQNAKRSDRPNPREDRNQPYDSRKNPRGQQTEDRDFSRRPKKKVELLPRNITQEDYIDALMDPTQDIVFAMGPAGTGKTMMATQYAIKGLLDGTFDKIVITRPAVNNDEAIGFLPGDMIAKMQPWMLPILDVFKEHFSPDQVTRMIEDEVIEIAPLAFMRGRTFKNCIIIADEMQNSKVSQMKMILTRIGDNSKMIVTGDVRQSDTGYAENGLKDFVKRIEDRDPEGISIIQFAPADVERHRIIEQLLSIYGED